MKIVSADCLGINKLVFPKTPDPDASLANAGFACKAVRTSEATLSLEHYLRGWANLNARERDQWIVDIEKRWFYLERLPAGEAPPKKKRKRNRKRTSSVEDDEGEEHLLQLVEGELKAEEEEEEEFEDRLEKILAEYDDDDDDDDAEEDVSGVGGGGGEHDDGDGDD